jgi:hypothetical protein
VVLCSVVVMGQWLSNVLSSGVGGVADPLARKLNGFPRRQIRALHNKYVLAMVYCRATRFNLAVIWIFWACPAGEPIVVVGG